VTEWFEQWFGEAYLKLYPHRDENDAADAVALIADFVPIQGARVLDLACGPGRHAKLLRQSGAQVVGFDLSMPLLSRARHRASPPLHVVRGDMRCLPFEPDTFDIVVNLFTSFGYFAEDRQHQKVLQEVASVLKKGGVLVLDYFNSLGLMEGLIEKEERAIGSQRVIIKRHFSDDRRFVLKEMHLMDDGRSFTERVRLFTPNELVTMISDVGLKVKQQFGDYDASSLTPESPRAILMAERK